MKPFRTLAFLLLAAALAVSSCGKKGDPIRPGEEPKEEEAF
jgi:hypothetical protein